MKIFVISQLRGGEFPGFHKVACPTLLDWTIGPSPNYAGNLIEVYETQDEAVKALRAIVAKIGPYYSITEAEITFGEPYGLAKESAHV